MYIVDLGCPEGHRFESWHKDRAEFLELRQSSELSCPYCQSKEIRALPTASKLSKGKTETMVAAPEMPMEIQEALSKVLRHVQDTHEDVGDHFAQTALNIHTGKEDARPIHGHSTADEEQELIDEGVPFAKLPIPNIEKN